MLSTAFRTGLDLPPDTDVTTLVFGEHLHWDSLGHMSLVAAIETTFGVSLGEKDVLKVDSYAAAIEIVKSALSTES